MTTNVFNMKWLGVGIAISVAVYITRSATPLWFFLIPALS